MIRFGIDTRKAKDLPERILARMTYVQRNFFALTRDALRQEAQAQATRGRPGLIRRTGKLESGVRAELFGGEEFGDAARIVVGVNLDEVPYARIHELGGVIRPKRSRYLVIPIGGGQFRRVKSVFIPQRAYLEPAARVVADKLQRLLNDAARLGDL